jgi:hypothetical protein
MSRIALVFALASVTAGCQLPPERPAPPPLLEDSPPLPYAQLLTRARQQATAATEAFYVNRWADLEEDAKGLEQTARFLKKATDVPVAHASTIGNDAEALRTDAAKLRENARSQNASQINEIMQRINLKVRELRIDAGS